MGNNMPPPYHSHSIPKVHLHESYPAPPPMPIYYDQQPPYDYLQNNNPNPSGPMEGYDRFQPWKDPS